MSNTKSFKINEISLAVSSFAIQAMIYEVSCFPSPGLVSPISSGAHRDMNFFTFVDSTAVLSRYLPLLVQEGFSDNTCKEIFENVRTIGLEAEKEMFIKTGGVNTHKGMLFLIGVACAATGKAIYEKKSFKHVQNIIKEMTKGIVEKELGSLKDTKDLSHGEKIFLKYNTKGVRGEVEAGIPTVFDFALDSYKKNMDLGINDRLVNTLIEIMQVCEDSTIVYRHSPEVLEEVKEKSRDITLLEGMRTSEGQEKLKELCIEFEERNISPGGSADLLGVTVFLYLVEEYMSNLGL